MTVDCTVSLQRRVPYQVKLLKCTAVAPPKITEKGSAQANDMNLAEQLMKLTKTIVDEKTHASDKGCPMHAAS